MIMPKLITVKKEGFELWSEIGLTTVSSDSADKK